MYVHLYTCSSEQKKLFCYNYCIILQCAKLVRGHNFLCCYNYNYPIRKERKFNFTPRKLRTRCTVLTRDNEHIVCLKRRLVLWNDGDLTSLLIEASTTQHRLEKSFRQRKTTDNSARQFADLIFQGKIKQALEMLSKNGTGGILRLEDTISTKDTSRSVKETLKSKHPPSQPAALDVCAQGHKYTHDAINATLVRSIALQARGACGPSGLEAYDSVLLSNRPQTHFVRH